MRKSVATVLLCFCFLIKAQTSFERSFGIASSADEAAGICSTSDKGFAILGANGNNTAYLIKTDSLGVKQWSMNYNIPGPYLNSKRNISQTSDGGFVFCGTANFFSSLGNRGYIAKVSSTGVLQWLNVYVTIGGLYSIKETYDGGYIAAGREASQNNVLIKTDASGNILWSKLLNQTVFGTFAAMDVLQLKSDSGYAVSYLYSPNGMTDYLVMGKYNKSGVMQWLKQVTNPTISMPLGFGGMFERQNGEIQFYRNGSFPGILSIKPDGSSGKSIVIGYGSLFNFFMSDHLSVNNEMYILAIYNLSNAQYYTYNTVAAKLDSNGVIKWAMQYGGAHDDIGVAMTYAKTKGIAIAGQTKSFSSGSFDISLIKTDTSGNSCHSSTIALSSSVQSISMVPFTASITSLSFTNYSNPVVSGVNATEIINNACICQPPVASFTPGNCMSDNSYWADKWYWTYSNGYVDSTVINSCPNFTTSGTYTVCLKVKNSCGSDSLCKVFNYVVIIWGVKENSLTEHFISYPNPAMTYIRFENKEGRQIDKIELFDLQGKRIMENFGSSDQLDVGELKKGIYQVLIYSKDKIYRNKFVKE
jgi:hypothetical protein